MSMTIEFIAPQLLDEKLKAEKKYWLQKLSGNLSVSGIPLDFSRPQALAPEKAAVELEFGGQMHTRLAQICGGNESLMFAVLVAALKVCLHKYTGLEDIIVGTCIHNRGGEVSSLNRVLAIRDHVSAQKTVKQLFVEVKSTLSEAYANQKYAFSRILELLQVENTENRQPLFNVAVGLTNFNDIEHLSLLKTELNLIFSIHGHGLTGRIEYSPALFKRETVNVFARQFATVLKAALEAPETPIGQLDLLSPERKHDLLTKFNNTAESYGRNWWIHGLFEHEAMARPGAIAVECKGESLSFAELNRKANQLAYYLKQCGVRPGSLVGLYLSHSINLIVAILGVLKAGGAYVPLDPSYPPSRISFIINDARIQVLLTQASLVDRVIHQPVRKLCLDSEWSFVEDMGTQDLEAFAAPTDLAYVIYTSGSTGEPKGVEVEHQSLLNYVLWAKDIYLREDTLNFPLYSSFAFDLTVTSIFVPLITGNRLIIYPDNGLDHPLFDLLRENRSGFLKLTPSHLSMMLDRGIKADSVRRVIVGGEAFTSELAGKIVPFFSDDVEIYNEYGPTEATVGCMIHRFDPVQDDRILVPIGIPAANTQIYILDEKQKPVGENVIGELFIAGVGLARGYLGRPELTAEKFVKNPFAPGKRMYRTGDHARWLPENVIQYVGRKDDQVKFHGYRVELNEIRTALNNHPLVKDSVVMVVKEAAGSDAMVAYYAADDPIDAGELRDFLADKIIEETLPNIFIHLAEIPLTANGKVDTRALPSLEQARQDSKRTVVRPRTQTEELLAAIWSRVMALPEIGVTDDFFGLGGHSLLAHQIISRTRATFQVDLPLRTLFEATTIEKLAVVLERILRERTGNSAPPLVARGERGKAPLSFGQQRLWFMNELRSGSVSYNIYPSFELEGSLNAAALEQSLNAIIRRHESLRTTFKVVDGQLSQVIAPELIIKVPFTDVSALPAEEQEAALRSTADEEAQKPFDLKEGPLVRAHLVRLEPQRHVLFLAMHHIISDAASMGIFYEELAAVYHGLCARTIPKLRELPVQYSDYSCWQRKWFEGEALQAEISYWRTQLEGSPPVLDLLPGAARPATITDKGTYQGIMLSKELSENVKELGRKYRCTLFMTLLAAFKVLVQYYAGCEDVVVGTDIANRNRPEIEGLIGFFVNTLALRTNLSGNPRFSDVLHRVREVCLAGFSHQELPFEKLVEELNPQRQSGRNPLFQIMFGFIQENSTLALDLPGLVLRPRPLNNKTAIFDFSLYMANTPDGLGGTAQYNTDLYDDATIAQFLYLLKALLARVVVQPDLTLSEINAVLRTSAQQHQSTVVKELKGRQIEHFRQFKQGKAAAALSQNVPQDTISTSIH